LNSPQGAQPNIYILGNNVTLYFQSGSVASPEPSRYMTRLCFHFSKKIVVQYDEQKGLAHFPWGRCTLLAHPSHIAFECESETGEGLAELRKVLESHVALFARRQTLEITWEAVHQGDVQADQAGSC
jgi:hypothetical protein